jgi:hypothetical protein
VWRGMTAVVRRPSLSSPVLRGRLVSSYACFFLTRPCWHQTRLSLIGHLLILMFLIRCCTQFLLFISFVSYVHELLFIHIVFLDLFLLVLVHVNFFLFFPETFTTEPALHAVGQVWFHLPFVLATRLANLLFVGFNPPKLQC